MRRENSQLNLYRVRLPSVCDNMAQQTDGLQPDRQTPAGNPESSGKNPESWAIVQSVNTLYGVLRMQPTDCPYPVTHWPTTHIKFDCLHSAPPPTAGIHISHN